MMLAGPGDPMEEPVSPGSANADAAHVLGVAGPALGVHCRREL
jgi:hypothetical protein